MAGQGRLKRLQGGQAGYVASWAPSQSSGRGRALHVPLGRNGGMTFEGGKKALDQPLTHGKQGGLGAVLEVELREDIAHVALDGLFT